MLQHSKPVVATHPLDAPPRIHSFRLRYLAHFTTCVLMRLVTWNCCRGSYSKKVPLLDVLQPDIAVLQECAYSQAESENCLCFGDNVKQGIVIRSAPPFRLSALPAIDEVPKYAFPVAVSGPLAFTLIAVWSKGKQRYPYVEAVVKAVEAYRKLITASPTVVIGDFNSNAIWDSSHSPKMCHTALVAQLAELGLISAYHSFFGEEHGRETAPTLYFRWQEHPSYHIDYCFIPQTWADKIQKVQIGSYQDWKQHSDHRPLLVDLDNGSL